MSFLRRLFGGADAPPSWVPTAGAPAASTTPAAASAAETATVRKIVAQLEALPPDRARLLAGAAYVVSRAANADLTITPEETALMERTLAAQPASPRRRPSSSWRSRASRPCSSARPRTTS